MSLDRLASGINNCLNPSIGKFNKFQWGWIYVLLSWVHLINNSYLSSIGRLDSVIAGFKNISINSLRVQCWSSFSQVEDKFSLQKIKVGTIYGMVPLVQFEIKVPVPIIVTKGVGTYFRARQCWFVLLLGEKERKRFVFCQFSPSRGIKRSLIRRRNIAPFARQLYLRDRLDLDFFTSNMAK